MNGNNEGQNKSSDFKVYNCKMNLVHMDAVLVVYASFVYVI